MEVYSLVVCPHATLPSTPAQPSPATRTERLVGRETEQPSFLPSQAGLCGGTRRQGRGWEVEQRILVWS